jgi:hypothetical protein
MLRAKCKDNPELLVCTQPQTQKDEQAGKSQGTSFFHQMSLVCSSFKIEFSVFPFVFFLVFHFVFMNLLVHIAYSLPHSAYEIPRLVQSCMYSPSSSTFCVVRSE